MGKRRTKANWMFLYDMVDRQQHDHHVWEYYFWQNLNAA